VALPPPSPLQPYRARQNVDYHHHQPINTPSWGKVLP
jgi:hypothetical protein